MKSTRHTVDQIIEKLRQADVALGQGQKVPEVCRQLEITSQTYYRWRQKYGGMAPEKASERRVCRVLGQSRSTQRYAPQRPAFEKKLLTEKASDFSAQASLGEPSNLRGLA